MRRLTKLAVLLTIGALILSAESTFAQKLSVTQDTPLTMTADRLIYEDNTQIATLIGNVKFQYEDMTMTSDKAVFNGKTKIGVFENNVKIWKPGSVLTGETMTVYYNEKRALLEKNVRGVTDQVSENGGKDKADSEPLIITCAEMEYLWGREFFLARENVKLVKGDKIAYADTATYEKQMDIATLKDNVKFLQGKNNWMTSPEAVFDLKSETFVARGGVKASVDVEKQKQSTKVNNDKIMSTSIELKMEEIMTDGPAEKIFEKPTEDTDYIVETGRLQLKNFHRRI